MAKTVKEILVCARELLTPPGAWIQGEAAQTKDGLIVSAKDENAVCFCAVGALERCADTYAGNTYRQAYLKLIAQGAKRQGSLVRWNDEDSRTQEEVLAVFDAAIASL